MVSKGSSSASACGGSEAAVTSVQEPIGLSVETPSGSSGNIPPDVSLTQEALVSQGNNEEGSMDCRLISDPAVDEFPSMHVQVQPTGSVDQFALH